MSAVPNKSFGSSPASRTLRAGARVGRYELDRLLGRGRMGEVYLATDPLIGRQIALKILVRAGESESANSERVRGRFLNEARSAGGLRHPGIVAIYDVVEPEDGEVALALEYVPGPTLRNRLADPEPIPMPFVADVITQLSAALDYAHRQGVVHRDIKPANIILALNGTMKITDFGIASLSGEELPEDLREMGTPNYLAPERFMGRKVDHLTDVYALGVTLYELVTRDVPYRADSMGGLAQKVFRGEYTDPSVHRPDLTPSLRRILVRGLEKRPEARFQSAGEMAQAFASALDSEAPTGTTLGTATPPASNDGTAVDGGRKETPPSLLVSPLARDSAEQTARAEAKPRSDRVRRLAAAATALAIVGGVLLWRPARETVGGWLGLGEETVGADEATPDAQALLEESRRLLAAGDLEGAAALLVNAQELSPEAREIAKLREQVESQHADLRAAELRRRVEEMFKSARASFTSGNYAEADTHLVRLLRLDADYQPALVLAQRVADARRAEQARLQQLEAQTRAAAEAEEAARRAELAAEQQAEVLPPPPGTLRVEFVSERPEGVLTVALAERELLRRPFRFERRAKWLRKRKPVGSFEQDHEVDSGTLELRVGLNLPDRGDQFISLQGGLAAQTVRTLHVQVDRQGTLTASFY